MPATATTPEAIGTITNPRNGETVKVYIKHSLAADKIRATASAPEFAVDIAGKVKQYTNRIRRGLTCRYRPSDAQLFWLHKIYNQLMGHEERPQAPREELTDNFSDIESLFTRAAGNLRYPKVRLQTSNGDPVVLSRAGQRSRHTGCINVTDGGRYGDNKWYGRINRDGTFTAGRECNQQVIDLLKVFAENPADTAAEYGRTTGNCCFCGRELTDERSTSVGYGPVCADNYGLPWGNRASACTHDHSADAADAEANAGIMAAAESEMEIEDVALAALQRTEFDGEDRDARGEL